MTTERSYHEGAHEGCTLPVPHEHIGSGMTAETWVRADWQRAVPEDEWDPDDEVGYGHHGVEER